MTEFSPEAREFLLAVADDKHFMGQQHAEWIGVAPFLEEDLAFCSIGQDELGHSAAIYELLIDDDARSDETSIELAVDALAFRRDVDSYRSCWLVEIAMLDWADTLVRHWMFDSADALRWELIGHGSVIELREIAGGVEREESFHRRHADGLLDALLSDAAANEVIGEAANRVAPFALGMFDPVGGDARAIAEGIASGSLAERRDEWVVMAEHRFGPLTWGDAPEQQNRTRRSDDFGALIARMREVLDFDPQAIW